MLMKSLVGLLFAIINASMPGGVPPQVKLGLDGVQTVLTYAFAGLGLLVMIGMKPVFDALKVQEDGPKKGEKMLGAQPDLTKAMGPAKYIVGCGCFALVLKMADTIDSMVSQSSTRPRRRRRRRPRSEQGRPKRKPRRRSPRSRLLRQRQRATLQSSRRACPRCPQSSCPPCPLARKRWRRFPRDSKHQSALF